MKKIIIKLLLIIGIAFLFIGCPPNNGEDTISFEDYSPHSFRIKNDTGFDLIAFAGSVAANNLISGVPALAEAHGLRKDTTLFNSTGPVVLFFITEENYNTYKNNLAESPVFTRIYAFYSHIGINNTIYHIHSSIISGDTPYAGRLNVVNPTNYYVELRLSGPNGIAIGYAVPQEMSYSIPLMPGSYNVFPVLKYYHPLLQVLYTIYPRHSEGPDQGKPIAWHNINIISGTNASVNVLEAITVLPDLSVGGVIIKLINNSDLPIQMSNNYIIQTDLSGLETINSGQNGTYFLPFGWNPDGTFPERLNFSQLRVGTVENMIRYSADLELELDYEYTITVTDGEAPLFITVGWPARGDRISIFDFN